MSNKTIEANFLTSKSRKPFQNSWSITYRRPQYDALGDPHASYYFLNKSMRKHLASLRKSIDKEGSFVEKKKIKHMINDRIKDYDSDNRTTKVEAYFFNVNSSPSISSLHSIQSGKSLLNEEGRGIKKRGRKDESDKQLSEKSKTLQVKNRILRVRELQEKSKALQETLVEKSSKSNMVRNSLALKKALDSETGISARSRNKTKNDTESEQKSKFLSAAPLERDRKQKVQLPKINISSQQVVKTKEQRQKAQKEKQQKRVTMFNKTQHNKFLKFLLEKKKKLSIQQSDISSTNLSHGNEQS